jgi:hypothetical protein
MTKQEHMNRISEILSIRTYFVSTGATEPREFFVAVANQLGLQELSAKKGKVDLAKLILQVLGEEWEECFFSEGSTITKAYFVKLLQVIEETFRD